MAKKHDFELAADDFSRGMTSLRLAHALALEDLRDRYRRSILGVLWISVSFILFLGVKAAVFSQLSMSAGEDFFLHLAIGFSLWTLISALVNGAVSAYTAHAGWILSSSIPYSLYFVKIIMRALMDFALVLAAAVALILFFSEPNKAGFVWLLPALLMIVVAAFGTCMLLAPLGALFRDSIHAVQTAMRILFFATPIIWIPVEGTRLEQIAAYNPVYHFIEIVRSPLMSGTVPATSWLVSGAVTLGLVAAGWLVFMRTKRTIPVYL